MTDAYQELGFESTGRIGFGDRPAVLVVDFQLGFTDPGFQLGGRPMVVSAVERTAELLGVARAARVPVVHCYTSYCGTRDALRWKIPAVVQEFHHGNRAVELDSRVYDRDYDVVVCKSGPSLFFQTPAVSYLVQERVDTVIVTGCNTSGCIRATIIDAFSYGFRVTVPRQCVGDVEEGPHNDNLRDVGRRYADVVSLDEALAYLNTIRGRNS